MRKRRFGLGRRFQLLWLIVAVFAVLSSGCAEPLTEEQRLADLDYLIDMFSKNHPFVALKSRAEGYDWPAHREEFESWVASAKSDREFAEAMRRVVQLLNNMHTSLRGASELSVWSRLDAATAEMFEPWVKIADEFDLDRAQYWFSLAGKNGSGNLPIVYAAGQYVVAGRAAGTTGTTLPMGSVVTEVNGLEVDGFVDSQRGVGWQPYDPIRGKTYERVLRLPLGPNSVTVKTLDGSFITETFDIRESGKTEGPLIPERLTGPYTLSTRNLAGFVIDGEVGYLAVRAMDADREGNPPASDLDAMRKFVNSVSDLPALIIDIRGNGGGQDPLWVHLASMLIPEPVQMELTVAVRDGEYVSPFYDFMVDKGGFAPTIEGSPVGHLPPEISDGGFRAPARGVWTFGPAQDSVKYAGKVFLLVDDRVASSAENFAAFSKATGFATLVGGVTGGDGLGFRLVYAVLPNSKMVVAFPLAMGINPDGSINEEAHTSPHYLVEWGPASIAKWVENRGRWHDVVLQECLKLAKAP